MMEITHTMNCHTEQFTPQVRVSYWYFRKMYTLKYV